VCSAILFALLFPRFSKLDSGELPWRSFLEQLLLWPGLFPNRPVLTVAWTLSWIMATYVLLPLPLLALRSLVRDGYRRVAVLACFVLAWVAYAHATGLASPRISYILAGCAVFELFAVFPSTRMRIPRLRLVLAGGAAALAVRFAIESSASWGPYDAVRSPLFTVFGHVGVTLLTAAAFVGQARSGVNYYGFPLDLIRRLGRAGYSFYMLHGPVTKIFAFSAFPFLAAAGIRAWAYWACMPLCFVLAAAASALLFVTVEQRIQRFMSRHLP
jgi:peptidoglycan/LPS O-acetylase OafA/YrhL